MKQYLLIFLVVFAVGASFFYFSQKRNTTPTSTPQIDFSSLSENDGESFKVFYENFMTDSLFQMSRINFPLEGLPSFAQTDHFQTGYYWTKDKWRMHQLIDVSKEGYTRELKNLGFLVVESVTNHQYNMASERRFKQDDNGEWYLIYYAGLNQIKN